MIRSERYFYYLQDIAVIKAKPKPLSVADLWRLQQMEAEVEEFAAANPEEAKRIHASLVP